LAIVPGVNFLSRLVLRVTVPLLQAALELILLAGDDIKVIVRQLAPLLFDLAF
jgi:hypothetical protein